jgi:hypothetical protein
MTAGEEMLAQLLEQSELDERRSTEYRWNDREYLRIFVKKHKLFAWDGPRTETALKLIEAARRKGHK